MHLRANRSHVWWLWVILPKPSVWTKGGGVKYSQSILPKTGLEALLPRPAEGSGYRTTESRRRCPISGQIVIPTNGDGDLLKSLVPRMQRAGCDAANQRMVCTR